MGLPITVCEVLGSVVRALNEMRGAQLRGVSAGYPDLLVEAEQLGRIFGSDIVPRLRYREDSAEIIKYHSAGGLLERIVDADSLFSAINVKLDVIDVAKIRGNEIILDLNQPCPQELHLKYQLVIDTGTCEHCFNVAQAAKNLADMTSVGGYIIQAVPLNVYNHGFYNMSPTWLHDFYRDNGFRIHYLKAITNAIHFPTIYDVPLTKRFNRAKERSILLTVVQRAVDKPIAWPVQTKYKSMLCSAEQANSVRQRQAPEGDTIEFPASALGYVSAQDRFLRFKDAIYKKVTLILPW